MKIPLIGVSAEIEKIRDLIKHVADTGLNVVITGESGVGKEVVAQNLYHASPRKGKPFIKINCAALPDGLLESELFGYEPGAFTGAVRKKKGRFELANKGVLFLDEIGEMSNMLQAKLLHVLQSGEYAPLGSERECKTDTWVIAASNRRLEEDIKDGIFRKDLYYRLSTIKIHIPPLRERPEDIPYLIDFYLSQYNPLFNKKKTDKLDQKILNIFMEYSWPGNVRELQNLLKRFIVMGDYDEVANEILYRKSMAEDLISNEIPTKELPESPDLTDKNFINFSDFSSLSLKEIKKKATDHAEKGAISYVLGKTNWNRSKAAKILKISYKTLLVKISELEIKAQ